jgi:hypothetical protein
MNVLKELVLLADRLDRKGFNKEAEFLDQILHKMAAKKEKEPVKKEKEMAEKKKVAPKKKTEKDQDGDGDEDFRDVMMARMKASGMSKEEAKKKSEKHDEKPKAKKS